MTLAFEPHVGILPLGVSVAHDLRETDADARSKSQRVLRASRAALRAAGSGGSGSDLPLVRAGGRESESRNGDARREQHKSQHKASRHRVIVGSARGNVKRP